MPVNINTTTLSGTIVTDPELVHRPSGMTILNFRLANSERQKISGNWVDRDNYFNIVVFGPYAESLGRYLKKGMPVACSGKLRWSEWGGEKDGERREAVEVIAETVQMFGSGQSAPARSQQRSQSMTDRTPAGAAGRDSYDDLPI